MKPRPRSGVSPIARLRARQLKASYATKPAERQLMADYWKAAEPRRLSMRQLAAKRARNALDMGKIFARVMS